MSAELNSMNGISFLWFILSVLCLSQAVAKIDWPVERHYFFVSALSQSKERSYYKDWSITITGPVPEDYRKVLREAIARDDLDKPDAVVLINVTETRFNKQ